MDLQHQFENLTEAIGLFRDLETCPPRIADLLENCMRTEPAERPTAKSIVLELQAYLMEAGYVGKGLEAGGEKRARKKEVLHPEPAIMAEGDVPCWESTALRQKGHSLAGSCDSSGDLSGEGLDTGPAGGSKGQPPISSLRVVFGKLVSPFQFLACPGFPSSCLNSDAGCRTENAADMLRSLDSHCENDLRDRA